MCRRRAVPARVGATADTASDGRHADRFRRYVPPHNRDGCSSSLRQSNRLFLILLYGGPCHHVHAPFDRSSRQWYPAARRQRDDDGRRLDHARRPRLAARYDATSNTLLLVFVWCLFGIIYNFALLMRCLRRLDYRHRCWRAIVDCGCVCRCVHLVATTQSFD